MKIIGQFGEEIEVQKGQFPGWYWNTYWSCSLSDSFHFRAAKESPESWFRLYAVLAPNVFRWIGNRETLTECIHDSEGIAIEPDLASKYFYL
jgi:hypothetical protein